MSILIVDDQKDMCWILSKVLAEAGFDVETATSATEALEKAEHRRIHAAIIDYRLPDRNGLTLFEILRKSTPTLPGILITSYGSNGLRQLALNQGFSAYLDKPFSNSTLLAHLKAAVNSP
jgi:DNA-binding response OmpR family regulator